MKSQEKEEVIEGKLISTILGFVLDVLEKVIIVPDDFMEKIKKLGQEKEMKRSCLQTVYQAFQYLHICQQILDVTIQDSYTHIETIQEYLKSREKQY